MNRKTRNGLLTQLAELSPRLTSPLETIKNSLDKVRHDSDFAISCWNIASSKRRAAAQSLIPSAFDANSDLHSPSSHDHPNRDRLSSFSRQSSSPVPVDDEEIADVPCALAFQVAQEQGEKHRCLISSFIFLLHSLSSLRWTCYIFLSYNPPPPLFSPLASQYQFSVLAILSFLPSLSFHDLYTMIDDAVDLSEPFPLAPDSDDSQSSISDEIVIEDDEENEMDNE